MTAPALKPFIKTLAELEPDVAGALSSWLPRLSLLFGALARTHAAGGDPDGFDGVTQRGRYDRLLLSEWAVALELPDEFLRRAVMNEHLFTELKRREPQGALHSVIVVDAGPDQLGAPRLLHLAAAIVGEARARKAKAAFAWGATTEPVRLFPRVDPESARHVLDARRAVPLSPASLVRWHAAISRFERPATEEVTPVIAWSPMFTPRRPSSPRPAARASEAAQVDVLFVGGAHLERLVASSPFAGKARVLRVDALHSSLSASLGPAARPRPLVLPLPDDALAVRALRDPFGVAKKAGPVPTLDVVASSGLVVPMGGRRVLVRTKRGLAALVEPNSPRAPLGAPREVSLAAGDVVMAAGLVGKRILAIVRDDKGLAAVFAGERFRLEGEIYPRLEGDPIDGTFLPADDRLRPLVPMPGEAPFHTDKTPTPIPEVGGTPRAFLDTASIGGTRGYALLPFHRRVTELSDGHLLPPMAHKGSGDTLVAKKSVGGTVVVKVNAAVRTLKLGDVERAYLGAFRAHGRVPGVLALGLASGTWVLVNGVTDDVPHVVLEPAGVQVLGAVQHPSHGACLVGTEDARRLVIMGAGTGAVERHSFASDIVEVAPNHELPQLAVLTKDGSVTVVYLKNGVRSLICRGTS